MKKGLQVILSVLLILSMLAAMSMTAVAEDDWEWKEVYYCGPNATWELDEETGVLTISGSGRLWDPCESIPEEYRYYDDEATRTTRIGGSGFCFDWRIRQVVITGSISEISRECFLECDSLWHVQLPSSVQKIGANAFAGCDFLTYINIPNGVNEIGMGAFSGTGLKELVLPQSVKRIGVNALRRGSYPSGATKLTIYNPDCEIYSELEFNYIYGYRNSTAHAYVKQYLEENWSKFYSYSWSSPPVTFIPFDAQDCTLKEHRYEEYTLKKTTCTKAGVTGYICSECGAYYVEDMPALNHRFEKNNKYCLNGCGTENPDYEPEAHTPEYTSVIIIKPTCKKNGLKELTCIYCGEKYTEQIPRTGHRYETAYHLEGSCDKEDEQAIFCQLCREVHTSYYSAKHTAREGSALIDENRLTYTYVCQNCEEAIEKSMDINGDGVVDISDISQCIFAFEEGDDSVDINSNCCVDIQDISLLLLSSVFGKNVQT